MLEAGGYKGRVVNVAVTDAKSGNQQMEVKCELLNGDQGTGEFRTAYLPLTDAALSSWVESKLTELGFNGDFGDPKLSDEVYTSVELYCKHETYNNETKEKWSIGGGPSNPPASRDVVNRLNARWRQKAGTSRPSGKPAVPARSAPPKSAPPPTEDEAPADVWTRDRAWDAWCAACEEQDKGSMPDTVQWKRSITERAAAVKRKESAFTPEDWEHIAAQCPPF